jgi:hypothetical protein
MENISKPELRHRRERKNKGWKGLDYFHMRYCLALFPFLPISWLWESTSVSIIVTAAQRYFATFVLDESCEDTAVHKIIFKYQAFF